MSQNYAVSIPHDKTNESLQDFPAPLKAKARYNDETNVGVSSVISLTHDTTVVEVYAGGSAAAIRWVPVTETAAVAPAGSVITAEGTTANYDHVVPVNTLRRFVVPMEVQGFSGSIQGVNRANGLYQRIAVKTFGVVGSVLTTEF